MPNYPILKTMVKRSIDQKYDSETLTLDSSVCIAHEVELRWKPVLPRCSMASRNWPEEGLVLQRRQARVAKRRRGEVVSTGTRATVAPSTVPRAGVGGTAGGSAEGEVSRRDRAADCRTGCRSAQDLVPGVYRGTHGCPLGADF